MTDLADELYKWTSSLPAWQQGLVAWLTHGSQLTREQRKAALGALMTTYEIPVPPSAEPVLPLPTLTRDHFAGYVTSSSPVKLVRLSELKGVNAVASGQALKFEPDGLTIVYGSNGAGKTSYSRVLKFVGRAVARDAQILSNVYEESEPERITAKIEISESSGVRAFEVDLRKEPPADLANFSVLDARCADNYVTSANAIAFTPEPLLVFNRLVSAQQLLREQVVAQIEQLERQRPDFSDFAPGTTVRARLDTLNANEKVAELDALAELSAEELARRGELALTIAAAQGGQLAEQKVAAERALSQLRELHKALTALIGKITDEAVAELARLEQEARITQEAARAAREQALSGHPLGGIGSESWRALWETARDFFEGEHAQHAAGGTFPPGEGAPCPLCLQGLDEPAANRMARFEAFLRDTTGQAADLAAQTHRDAINELTDELVERCQVAIVDVIRDASPEAGASIDAFISGATNRIAKLRVGPASSVSAKPLPADPRDAVIERGRYFKARIAELEAAEQQEKLDALRRELAELEARTHLGSRLADAKAYVGRLDAHAKLTRLVAALETRTISNKQRALAETVVTEALAERVDAELSALALDSVEIDVKPKGRSGTTLTELRLRSGAEMHSLPSILSEGEQRALATAFFLAEITAPGHAGGVVFDDPVSSFDQERRESIAGRIVAEAKRRQVIVFTHDLAFMIRLRDLADKGGVSVGYQRVWRAGALVGMTAEEVPWAAMNVKKRLTALNTRLDNFERPEDVGPDRYEQAVKHFYEQLRETWERAVEELLLGGVVERFGPDVKTQSLNEVYVTGQIIAEVTAAMEHCSRFTHDAPPGNVPALPSIQHMRTDAAQLSAFAKRVRKERDAAHSAS